MVLLEELRLLVGWYSPSVGWISRGWGDTFGKLYCCRGQRNVLLCGHAGFAGVEVLRRDIERASFSLYLRVVKWTFFGGGGNVDQITELRKGGKLRFAMAQANGGAAGASGGATGANAAVPQVDGAAVVDGVAVVDGAVPLVTGAVLPQIDGARVRGADQAAAPVAGPLVAPVAVALIPQGFVPARFDMDGVLLGPLPTKSNKSCKILSKIAGDTWP